MLLGDYCFTHQKDSQKEDSRPTRLISRKVSSVSFLTNDDCNRASDRTNLREWGLDLDLQGPGRFSLLGQERHGSRNKRLLLLQDWSIREQRVKLEPKADTTFKA